MGNGLSFICRKCGCRKSANTGIGYLFPIDYRETVERIRNGEYGLEWKELFESTPGAAVNAGMDFYVCPSCGAVDNDLNLSIYQLKKLKRSQDHEKEYVVPNELKADYILVKEYVHACPTCGKPMKLYTEGDKVKCPECRDGWMEVDPERSVHWD